VTGEDLGGDAVTLKLQAMFQCIYGWQDRLVLRVDTWCRGGRNEPGFNKAWYSDSIGLRLSGLLGFGTELFLLMICSLLCQLWLYLFLNVFVMSGIMMLSVFYRRLYLRATLSPKGQS
jgi:hypothetical protein